MAEQRPQMATPSRHDGPPPLSQSHQKRHGKRPRGFNNNNYESRRGRPRRRKQHFGVAPPTKKPSCSQCSTENPKYKCPKCRAPYCSIACCRSHKEKGCEENKVQENYKQAPKSKYLPASDLLQRNPLENAIQRRKQAAEEEVDLVEGWKITENMMDKMDNCDWLRTELQDGGLRQIIQQVCEASNTVAHRSDQKTHQELALEQAKAKYPNFDRFMDKLLVLTGVLERQETEEELSEWLTRQEDEELGPLALVPLPRKRRPVDALQDLKDEMSSSSDDSSSESESDDSVSSSSDATTSDDDDDGEDRTK